MQIRIPKQWLEEYFRKSGDKKLENGNVVVLPFGFCVWDVNHNGDLLLLHVYVVNGYGKLMDSFINELARQIKAKKIIFATRRNPKAFERKYGFKLVGHILEREVK